MSKTAVPIAALLGCLLAAATALGNDWENPVFQDADDAVRAALAELAEVAPGEYSPREMFALFTVSSAERPGDPRFRDVHRRTVDSFLVTFPAYLEDDRARRTLDDFLAEVEDEKAGLGKRLGRFAYPPLPGLTYLKLVENVDQLQERPDAERSAQIQGVTYFCRYVVIPLSYVTARSLEELNNDTLGAGAGATLREWQRESFRVMLSTFRHEMVHVWTNSSLGPPVYGDRQRYPQWFLEGSASFLAADPHTGLSQRYQRYQNLFFYLVERHGVAALRAFFEHALAGAAAVESLEEVYGISGSRELRARAERWHGVKDLVRTVLVLALLIVVLAAVVSRRLPVFGSLQVWLAVTLAYSTFSGFCATTQALNGATAVVVQQVIFGAGAAFLAVRGLRSMRRSVRGGT